MGNENEGEAMGNGINENGGEAIENEIIENEGEVVGIEINENEVGGMPNENGGKVVGDENEGDAMVGVDAGNENGDEIGEWNYYVPSFGFLIHLYDFLERDNLPPWDEPRNDDDDDDYYEPEIPLHYDNYNEYHEAMNALNVEYDEDVEDENDEDVMDEDEGGAGVEDIGGDENDVGGEEPGQTNQQEAPRTLPIVDQISVKRISNFINKVRNTKLNKCYGSST